jgi:chitin-binding protein
MRRSIAYPLVILGAVGSTLAVTSPALAHGYVSSPPSRQALCASGDVKNCGPIEFEPQSVEGPKGLRSCDGGNGPFSALADESRNWPAKAVGTKVTFSWVKRARHRTLNWEYFIGGKKVATVPGGNAQPDAVVNHEIDLSGFRGRQTVLAVWNIGDTPMAFYNCVDLTIGGGGGNDSPPPVADVKPPVEEVKPPAEEVKPPVNDAKPPVQDANPPQQAAPAPEQGQSGTEWARNTAYRTGDVVTYQGARYTCRQSHTSLITWEPSIYTLALWMPV